MVKIIPAFVEGKLDLEASEYVRYTPENGLPDAGLGVNFIDGEMYVFSGELEKTYGYNSETDRFEERKFFFDEYIDWERPGTRPLETSDGKVFFNADDGS